jgi:hypothetical protein
VYTESVKYRPLTAVGTNRTIDVSHLDRPAVFLCFAQATEKEPEPVEAAIREHYTASQVLIGHVVDLHGVPGMMRGMAERILASEYEKAVAALPEGETVEDYVVLLPDWDAAFIRSLGFSEDVSKRMGVAVFGRDGALLGTAQGEGAADACLGWLSKAGA